MTSLSKTYAYLVSGYCRINDGNYKLSLFCYLQQLVMKYYKVSNKSRRILCPNRLFSLYMDKRYRIIKYFTLSNFNKSLSFKLVIDCKIKLLIKVFPLLSKYQAYYQSGSSDPQKFDLNLNLLQFPYNYPITTNIRGKVILGGNEYGTDHLLQIHFYTEKLVHIGHLSVKLKGKDVNHGMLHLEWESILLPRDKEVQDYKGGYLKVLTNPDPLIHNENLTNWKLMQE